MEIFYSGLFMPRLAVYTGLDGAMLFKFFYVEVVHIYTYIYISKNIEK